VQNQPTTDVLGQRPLILVLALALVKVKFLCTPKKNLEDAELEVGGTAGTAG
jgi:hypothetical protein